MFGRNGLRDHLFLLLNMYLMFFIGAATRTDVWNQLIIRRMAMTLFTEALLVFIASMLPVIPSLILSLVAVATGILMTFLGRKRSIGGHVNFMHLTERAMLYVVQTFGEMIIAVAGFFNDAGKGLNLPMICYSVFAFLIPVGLFLSYEILYNYLIDREGNYNGLLHVHSYLYPVCVKQCDGIDSFHA